MSAIGAMNEIGSYIHRGWSSRFRTSIWRARRVPWVIGPALTAFTLVAIELLALYGLRIPNPAAIYFTAVVFAAFVGGLLSGLVAAGITVAYAFYFFSIPGQLLSFTPDNLLRVIVLSVTTPTMAMLVGIFKIQAMGQLRERSAMLKSKVGAQTSVLAATRRDLQAEIGERQVLEEQLREANEEMQAIIDSSPAAIFALDPDYKVTLWNAAAERIFGYQAKDVQGQETPLVTAEDWAAFEDAFSRVSAGEVLRQVDAIKRRKDGAEIEIRFSAAPLHDRMGQFRGVMYVAEDITRRRLARQQLIQAQKMEAVGQLTGGVAHDFNNLLTVILGGAESLVEQLADDPRLCHLAEMTQTAALRGAALTQGLLAFSRRQSLDPRPIDIRDLVASTAALLERTLCENIKIELDVAGDVAPALADPVQLESALMNLAINARDAMPKGGTLMIEAANKHLDESYAAESDEVNPGGYVMLAVKDTGTGIPADVMSRVFEPFFTTKALGKGSGLGLSMVYGFVKQSNGHVKIDSEPGNGTTVRLYLPRASEARDSRDDAAAVSFIPRGNGETVLLAEDNAEVRYVVATQLKDLGYQVHEVDNATQALEVLARTDRIDLLMTDIVMRGRMTGTDLAHEARKLRPALKVLLTSGFARTSAMAADADGSFGFLAKPYRKAELAQEVRSALAKPQPAPVAL